MANRIYNVVLYVDNDGKKRSIELSTDSIAAQDVAPATGAPDIKGLVKISGSRRGYGVHPRGWRLTRLSGAAGSRLLYDFHVVTDDTSWKAKSRGATVVIGGNTWTITSNVSEVIR